MNPKTRLFAILAAAALLVPILAVVLVRCAQQPAPGTQTPGATTVATGAATEEPEATLGPIPTLTKEQGIAQEIAKSGGQFTSSAHECDEILKTEDWCGVIRGAVHIIRPEWEELLPQTEFFVVNRDLHSGHFVEQQNLLIVEQDGRRYTPETFDRLLVVNSITITDENRELVAEALVLMTLADYMEAEIVFTDWEEGDWPARFGNRFNYSLMVWTEIQGLNTRWFFRFEEDGLRDVRRMESEYHVGDYIDVPFETLPLPPIEEYFFTES